MVGCQITACPGVIEMRPAAGILRGKGVGESGSPVRQHRQPGAVQPLGPGLPNKRLAIRVIAKQANGRHRHGGVEPPDIDGKVAGRATAPDLFFMDDDKVFLAGPSLDKLVVVGAPGATGHKAVPVPGGSHSASGASTGSVTRRSSSSCRAGRIFLPARLS